MRGALLDKDAIVRVATIECRLEPYDWGFVRDEAARIDAHWAARCQEKPGLFDGRVLMMHQLAVEGDCLRASCFEASYRSFLTWRESGFPGTPVANLFGMAALRAADGAFMLGEMSPGTAAAGRLYFPAGTPEPADLDSDGRLDFQANVLRELEEETGLGADEVTLDDGWTIVISGRLIACMKLIRSSATVAELQARLAASNATQADPELVNLVPVTSRADYDGARMPAFMLSYLDWALAETRQAL